MLMTEPPLSKPFQLPLVDDNNQTIIPESKAKCPNCGKRGHVRVIPHSGLWTPEGYRRERVCWGCKYTWETEMILPEQCPSCKAVRNFGVKNTVNSPKGIYRIHKCGCCGSCLSSFEPFPVPEHKVRRPDLSKYA